MRLNSQRGTEGLPVSSINCDWPTLLVQLHLAKFLSSPNSSITWRGGSKQG